jgi:hypothetical protein
VNGYQPVFQVLVERIDIIDATFYLLSLEFWQVSIPTSRANTLLVALAMVLAHIPLKACLTRYF